jgi:hypothetical protein
LEASRKIITKKWFIFLAFFIVVGLMAAAGVIIVCIGLLASLPAAMCMVYASFEDVTQLNDHSGNDDEIERHLVI